MVGYPGYESYIASFAGSSDAPCMLDDGYGVLFGYHAGKDDLFVIDQSGQVFYYLDVGERPLSTGANRTELDGVVRGLLGG